MILVSSLSAVLAACGGGSRSGALPVVASTNVYGDIVSQIGGSHVAVTSILEDPNADPHLFEPGAANALAVAKARVVVQNGLGYDDFMKKLESAAPNSGRGVVVAAAVLGIRGAGANPHLWYDVPLLPKIAAAIAASLAKADPAHAPAYRKRLASFKASLAPLDRAVAAIRAKYAGVPVAYTEPVPGYLVTAAGLHNLAPASFTRLIMQGSEPAPSAVSAMMALTVHRRISVLLYNKQSVSPITARLQAAATKAGVAVVGVTETLPPGATFQGWQLGQVESLRRALAR